MEKQWYSIKEAATYLGVSIPTAYKLINKGALAAYRYTEKSYMHFKKSDLDKLIEASKVKDGE
jgi:excisionase family DNA binding protein